MTDVSASDLPVRLAHLSDTHVGFTQYSARTTSGRPAREQDFLRAFRQVIDHVNDFDPPLVIHSGDFYDKAYVSLRQQKQGQLGLQMLAARPDGTSRVVVVISGNHDQPADPREPAALELNEPIAGVHVVTSGYQVIDLEPLVDAGLADASLRSVVVHALPHDQLRTVDQDSVVPLDGRVNILVTHGVVGGSELYKTTKGREYAIDADIIGRGWHYIALGHWHKRCAVPGGGLGVKDTPAWYAGSTENNGFADVAGNESHVGRGYLQVTLDPCVPPAPPNVKGIDLPVRAMFSLPPVDAAGKSSAQVADEVVANAAAADVAGAVVRQRVVNVTTDEWACLDLDRMRRAGREALWFSLEPVYLRSSDELEPSESSDASSLSATLETVTRQLFAQDPMCEQVLELASSLLSASLADAGASAGDTQTESRTASDDDAAVREQDVA